MESIYKLINRKYLRLSRHAFQSHPRGHTMFQDLDDLIIQKDNFIDYIKFEYSLAIFYNLVVSVPSLFYLFSRFSSICRCDMISTLWITVVSIIKLVEIIPKALLVYQSIRISNSSNDPVVCSRRLMYMTRSNVFFYNTILGYILLISYTAYFLLVRRGVPCERAGQFYYIVNWLIFGFFLRLIISFINYFLHFKYAINEADVANSDLYVDYSNRVSEEVLKMIECIKLTEGNITELIPLTEDNDRDVCCICILPFQVDEKIKLMPCNRKHIFHQTCIDKWLSHHKACPTCRKEINKKLIQKSKIY